MKFYSTKTYKLYDDIKELQDAEKRFDEEEKKKRAALEEKKRKKEELKNKHSERIKEIETLLIKKQEIDKEIKEKINSFVKDYGYYQFSVENHNNDFLTFDF